MVRFENKKLIIEIETACSPVDTWLAIQEEIYDLLAVQSDDNVIKPNYVVELLKAMQPDFQLAKCMEVKV